ncbi:MAG: transcription antitermination factor NusB, partial [Acidimicrobiia bacterium]|nr:transcription antitermination factor NusB [Acidimicrobiia bacterium]MDX2466875.1 transcription antitermination factor NusB [Acidimicrobiia bacterium]
MNTRAIAAGILIRIRDEGAYSNVILPQATQDLSGPDRGFVYSLVTGALRRMRLIDAIIEAGSGRSIDQLLRADGVGRPFEHLGRGLFAAWSPTVGVEPWVTDGTIAGTRLLADLVVGATPGGSAPGLFTRFGART